MSRLFTADYAQGNVNQWTRVQNKDFEIVSHLHPKAGHYPNTVIVDDPDCGYCVRYEVRNGDIPPTVTSGERSDVTGDANSYAAAGTTRWYAFSVKFDETFPTSHTTIGWEAFISWKGCKLSPYTEYGSNVIGFGWGLVEADTWEDGRWYLLYNPQSEPLVYDDYARPILDFPLDVGKWHDIKMRAYWRQDYTGTIQIWHNGIRQTFNEEFGGGGTTFTGQTVCGGSDPTGVMVHQGPYRQTGSGYGRVGITGATEIEYFTNFRMADSEDGL